MCYSLQSVIPWGEGLRPGIPLCISTITLLQPCLQRTYIG